MSKKDYLYERCQKLEKANEALRSENAELKTQCAEAKDDYTELETEHQALKVANERLHEELNAAAPSEDTACLREIRVTVRKLLQHLSPS